MDNDTFRSTAYTIGRLVDKIVGQEIALPDIQRPFVWSNTDVRNLLDSIFRGYPVGHLLLWENDTSRTTKVKIIGGNSQQQEPDMLVIDGQQRLTSLYAVITGQKITRKNGTKEAIKIAFNPIQERFFVSNAVNQKSITYLQDISKLWEKDVDMFEIAEQYVSNNNLTDREQIAKAKKAINSVSQFKNIKLPTLILDKLISEEEIAEIFVRTNSKGKRLSQADFILTLMSVHWDEGRFDLEKFCEDARNPTAEKPSAFNHFIKPSPDQLIRVVVGYGFERARLKDIYSILKGKNIDTGTYSSSNRESQFEILKKAQEKSLNLNSWHSFMSCIKFAGFRDNKMISSNASLLFAYVLYLIGQLKYSVPQRELKKCIAQWFFMSSMTGRYTGSSETAMESDLFEFQDVKDTDSFISQISKLCETSLTQDYWNITLPSNLAKSAKGETASSLAYCASLVILGAKVLFSPQKLADLWDHTVQPPRFGIERHHLFPKEYLSSLGYSERDINQIANYAYIEWSDNLNISDKAPSEYVPELTSNYSIKELKQMYYFHALPDGWEHMEYPEFLAKRQKLISEIVYEAYTKLTN